ncbi:MAG: sulfatase-like hydrolase/transferase [Halosimplex sp.]
MDVVWLIVDSLSYRASSFAPDGPDTTPGLAELAAERGVVFSNAYAPGPLSPSSHASMFTGELPSVTGMHEAHPYFDGDLPLLAERMRESHRTTLLSLNMWLFQGLDAGFDEAKDFSRQYLLFREATDPVNYFRKHDVEERSLRGLTSFAMADGKPVRSLLNYLNCKREGDSLVPDNWGDAESYQYAGVINEQIRETLVDDGAEQFVVANYMDVHPPFDASDEALERFAPEFDREDLPIGVSPERHLENDEKSYDVDAMEALYRAVVWDFDRKLTPLLERLLADDTFVVVTSDHGIWNRDTAYDENRLHVPLVVFSPEVEARVVDETVNLRSIPRTIVQATQGPEAAERFPGRSLLDVTEDEVSVTEVIHHPNDVYERTGRVDVTKSMDADAAVQRDLVLVEGDARVDYVAGEWRVVRGDDDETDALREYGEEILDADVELGDGDLEYDDVTEQRLEDLGYM